MSRRRKIAAVAGSIALCALLLLAFCPRPDLYGDTGFSAAIEDRDGKLLRLTLAPDDRYRLKTALEDIAPAAVDATLLYEDQYFRVHPGFNPLALLRAAWTTYVHGDRAMGASTITMQLARLRYDLDTRSIAGKLVQIARAVQFERHYAKDEILEAYLNLAPYGGNVEGIGTASLVYFDVPAADLSLPEALALAVIAQNPVMRDPSRHAGYEQMNAARRRLLAMWIDAYGIDADMRAQFDLPLRVRGTGALPFRAPHFVQAIERGQRETVGIARTSLDLDLQTLAERSVQNYTQQKRSIGIRNASVMLVDWRNMQVLASVGSADFFDAALQGQVDGTAARRSPGSTLKPFLYGLAMDRGIIHPMSLMKDAPARFAAYTPENFDRGFMGPIKAQDALIYSRNVPAIDLLSKVGHQAFRDFLDDGGIAGLRGADYYGLAMILGGMELSMQELVTLYAMLANGGTLQALATRPGTPPADDRKRLLSAEAAYLVLDMLRRNPRPGATPLQAGSHEVPVAWKTGTSYAFRDAWSVGVFGPYVLAVWVGNFDGSGNPAFVGRSAAAPLFFALVDALSGTVPESQYNVQPAPDLNLRKVDVCADTGDLPGRHCPRTVPSWFIPGTSPITVSNVHRAIRIDVASGRRSCSFDPATTRVEIFEVWPSDIQQVFRKAGIAIRRPPPWSEDCAMQARNADGIAPRITSPAAGLGYRLRSSKLDEERIALEAVADGDVGWLYWFANDRFIARVRRDQAYFWQPAPGDYTIVAVDDLGRGDARQLHVSLAR